MFGFQLTLLQKLEIAFVLVVLGVAGVFIFQAFRPEQDKFISVNTFTKQHPKQDNPNQPLPVTATNPRDEKKDEKILQITTADGRFFISQYPNDPSRHMAFKWEPDTRHPGQEFQYYRSPMAGIDGYSDPFKKAIAFATYKKVYEVPRGLGLLGSAAMTDAQAKQEEEARKLMEAEITNVKSKLEEGTFQPVLLEEVFKAIKAYDATPGDPLKNKAKAKAARLILEAAVKYMAANQDEQDKAIDKYITAMDKLLAEDQKQKVITAYQAYVQRTTPVNRGRGVPVGGTPGGRTGVTPTPGARGTVTPTPTPGRGTATAPRGGA
jgi:hypothetical protein